MLSLDSELETAPIDDDARRRLLAIERREVFSVWGELRFALYAGVVLIAWGVGLWLSKNVDRIGHGTLIAIVAVAAAACYAVAARIALRAEKDESRVGSEDYLLLLASLLLSADIAYVENVYSIFGDAWRWHLLILAAIHGATAYLFDSRLVLSLSVGSLAAFIGVDREGSFLGEGAAEAGLRLLTAAGAIALWRVANAAIPRRRGFNQVFEHFAANFALFGGLVWIFEDSLRWVGFAILLAAAVATALLGIRTRRELFVVYAILYFVVGLDFVVGFTIDRSGISGSEKLILFWMMISTPAAIVALWVLHRRWRDLWA